MIDVTQCIAAVASLKPFAIAVEQNELSLTYSALEQRSARFARYLCALGIAAGDVVAIRLERSIDWIVAALGVMRAGAAYLPIDPSWPNHRVSLVLGDSRASALVAPASELADEASICRVDPFSDAQRIAQMPPITPRTIRPDGLAYVIYTSGSTGAPKGVEITHANLSHLARWHQRAFDAGGADRVSHLAGLAFDAAVWEVWPNLCAGATLVLADEAVRWSPERIQQWMLRNRVTVGFVPTVHAQSLIGLKWPETTALRYLLTGGDVLQQAPTQPLPFRLINNYGPTECTVVSTSGLVNEDGSLAPSIGRAIDGASVYLLDELEKPVGDGTSGEIYIGGKGVGIGYRNDDRATRSSFPPDPFSPLPNARMFRTGDYALRLPNGELKFLGRRDRQVKIRGQRIELDEISAVLSQHPSVETAIASTYHSAAGELRLVCYLVPRKDAQFPDTREFQKFALARLPEPMVPSTVIKLEAIPLTANGKVDFSALPAPESIAESSSQGIDSTSINGELLAIVRETLEDDTVTSQDNFFLVGGHSLLGMQLILRLEKAFAVTLSLQELFEAATVEGLGDTIQRKLRDSKLLSMWKEVLTRDDIGLDDEFFSAGGSPALADTLSERIAAEFGVDIAAPLFFDHITARRQSETLSGVLARACPLPDGVIALWPDGERSKIFWVHYVNANLAKALGDDHPYFSVALVSDDMARLGPAPSLTAIAARLIEKIRAIQPNGPYLIGGLCLGAVLAYEVATQLQAAREKLALVVMVDPPDPAVYTQRRSLASRFNYFRYLIRRAEWLGPRVTLQYALEHLVRLLPRPWWPRFGVHDWNVAQETIESAVFAYNPGPYDGKVLMFLASERIEPPVPCWRTTNPSDLSTHIVEAYHRELMEHPNVEKIAEMIIEHVGDGDRESVASAKASVGSARLPSGTTVGA